MAMAAVEAAPPRSGDRQVEVDAQSPTRHVDENSSPLTHTRPQTSNICRSRIMGGCDNHDVEGIDECANHHCPRPG